MLAVQHMSFAIEPIHAHCGDDLQRFGWLDDSLNVPAHVIQGVGVVVLNAGGGRVEVGGNAVAITVAAVLIILVFDIQPAIQGQTVGSNPGQVTQHTGLLLVPLTALPWRIANGDATEGDFPVILVTVVIDLVAQANVVAHLPVEMHSQLLHVTVIAVIGVARVGTAAIRVELSLGHEARLVSLMVVETRYQPKLHPRLIVGVEPFAAQRVFFRCIVIPIAIGGLTGQEIVLRKIT
ncbi:hypothetical protein D3C76_971920 [compost metagenome]